jgi:protease II
MNRYVIYSKKNDKDENSFYIKRNYTNQEYLITVSKGNIIDIAWSTDEKYLFFIYSDIKNISKKVKKNEYFCMVFDTESKKSIRLFRDQDFKLLSVYGRLLAVESGTGADSKVMFYDYLKDSIYLNLDIKGGCAIKNLPLAK